MTQVGSAGQVPPETGLAFCCAAPCSPHASLGLAQGSPVPITGPQAGLGDPTGPPHPDWGTHHVEPGTYLLGSLTLSQTPQGQIPLSFLCP